MQPPGTNDPALVQYLPPQANPDVGKDVGGVSQLDIKYTLRFNNGLVIVEVNAAQLLSVMEHSIGFDGVGKVTACRFPQVAGMLFSFDPAVPPGDHIRSLAIVDAIGEVSDRVVEGGEPVGVPERTIKVVTLDYLADGGDYFPFPSPANGRLDLAEEMADLGEGLATFAAPGPERNAFAECLPSQFTDTPFKQADTPREQDRRIQNLGIPGVLDTVLNQ